jgi:uncharacterized membrane protein
MTVGVGIVALVHAALTWPAAAVLALFGGGAAIAFAGEAIVISLGWLEHHVGPKVLGVPLYVLAGWTGIAYAAFRVALLSTEGVTAVALAAGLATGYDLLTDHRGVAEAYWTYTDDLPGPRYRGVPWWNFAGWLMISSVTAALSLPFL